MSDLTFGSLIHFEFIFLCMVLGLEIRNLLISLFNSLVLVNLFWFTGILCTIFVIVL